MSNAGLNDKKSTDTTSKPTSLPLNIELQIKTLFDPTEFKLLNLSSSSSNLHGYR